MVLPRFRTPDMVSPQARDPDRDRIHLRRIDAVFKAAAQPVDCVGLATCHFVRCRGQASPQSRWTRHPSATGSTTMFHPCLMGSALPGVWDDDGLVSRHKRSTTRSDYRQRRGHTARGAGRGLRALGNLVRLQGSLVPLGTSRLARHRGHPNPYRSDIDRMGRTPVLCVRELTCRNKTENPSGCAA